MNGAHLHLLFNHFPMAGLVFSILVLGFGLVCKSVGFVRSGLLVAVISGAFAIPTYLTGEPAEEVIEHTPGFSEAFLEEHEDAAEFAAWAMGLTGLAAAAGLYFSIKKNRVPKLLMISIIVFHLFSLAVVGRTNNLGGKISHPEIRDHNEKTPSPEAPQ